MYYNNKVNLNFMLCGTEYNKKINNTLYTKYYTGDGTYQLHLLELQNY